MTSDSRILRFWARLKHLRHAVRLLSQGHLLELTEQNKAIEKRTGSLEQQADESRERQQQFDERCRALLEHFERMESAVAALQQELKHERNRSEEARESIRDESRKLQKQLKQLSEEIEPLVRLAFYEDEWLARNRDLHRGERCFLLGCGPSLNEVDLTRLNGELVMGVNGTYMLEELELTYFASVSHIFWKHHVDGLKRMRCRRRFLPFYLSMLESDCPTSWFNFVDHQHYGRMNVPHPAGFSTEPHRLIYGGATVIYPCLQILYHLGVTEVVLLGLDHDYGVDTNAVGRSVVSVPSEELQAHFRDDYYPGGGEVFIDIHTTELAYAMSRDRYAADGRRIVNATPGTKLDVYEQVALESIIG
jgi:hypothetical protein